MKIHTMAAMMMALVPMLGHGRDAITTPGPGLSIRGGVLTLRGTPFCGIGANYFSLFSRTLKDPSDTSYDTGLASLANAGVPFVRFMACAFWPSQWHLYLEDKAAYFARLDSVVRSAETHGIGLIPSLFWHMSTVPDLVGEPMDQYGNLDSKTLAFVRRYTREVVLRYRESPAIWGWEFGNEYNLAVDLPNASTHRPPVVPELKTAGHRTARDELSSLAMLCAFGEFAKTVRQHDTHRILITGNALPRPSAFHNTLEKTWTKDSADEFEGILLRDNPAPFDTLSVHIYADAKPDYPGDAKTLTDLVHTLQGVSARARKALFIGEFGAPRALGRDAERAGFTALIKAIETHHVPLSAFWVYDYPAQKDNWNVTRDNERRYMLSLVGQANQRMSARAGGRAQTAPSQDTPSGAGSMDFIESRLPPKPGMPGKRVFIDEYGFSLESGTTPEIQIRYSRDVCMAAMAWGCPFVLYWEMYCNEVTDGRHRGFSLVDDHNVPQPFYHWLEAYYRHSRQFVRDFKRTHGRAPAQDEFTTHTMRSLAQL